MKSGDPAKFKNFPRGTTLLIKVTPDAKSKITSIKVSGPDAKAKLCKDKPTCTFVINDFAEFTATFEPRTRPLPFGQ
jgi:hypothetical protein